MDTVVLKFGGSSVANNEKLQIVADKIIDFYKNNNVVVVVSAQGKTTDNLIKEAQSLCNNPDKRELDVLLSTGEQITIAKLAILLKSLGYNAISLTGWQAGIYTSDVNQDAIIKNIDTTRINQELEKRNIVIVAGFQGITSNNDIATLGRGGSDTTAVAIAAAIKSDKCYIYSDVDGVFTADPRKVPNAKKLENISYEEMIEISSEGAKVLHNRCIEIGENHNIPIVAKSTFEEGTGTTITHTDDIEGTVIKNIVKKEISRISIIGHGIISNNDVYKKIMSIIEKNNLDVLTIDISRSKIAIVFKNVVSDDILKELHDEVIGN
ncbi:MAG: aspartate kinase [Clostridia bacterium]|nr:aspartate kinase [Clostridia bacterium]